MNSQPQRGCIHARRLFADTTPAAWNFYRPHPGQLVPRNPGL